MSQPSTLNLYVDNTVEEPTLVKKNQTKDLNNSKLTFLDNNALNKNRVSDEEVVKKHVDDTLSEDTVLRFDQTLQNYLKVSVGNNVYNHRKYNTTKKKFQTQVDLFYNNGT